MKIRFLRNKLSFGNVQTFGKIILSLGLIFLTYQKLFVHNDFNKNFQYYIHTDQNLNWWLAIVSIFLLIPNIVLEVLKWKLAMIPIRKLNFMIALKSILTGLTFGIFTPSRIGDYGGRILFLNKGNRVKSMIPTFYSSIGQNTAHILLGVSSLFILNTNEFFTRDQMILSGIFFIGILSLYFGLPHILNRLRRLEFLRKFNFFHIILDYPIKFNFLFIILFYSILRLCVYSCQFILLLYFFGINAPIQIQIFGTLITFMLQSFVPLPPAISVLVKSQIAFFLWAPYVEDAELGILFASTALWIINVLFPALLGWIIILKTNFGKSINDKRI